MKINFVTIGDASIASCRYHNQIPARELQLRGHIADITPYPLVGFDAYVFSKHFNPGDYWYARGLKAEGKKTIFHCCDHHIDGQHGLHYSNMLHLADKIIVPTRQMQAVISLRMDRESIIIPDTYELPQADAIYNPGEKLKVLWFGHPLNLKSLQNVLPLPDFCELRLCTDLLNPKGEQISLPKVFDGVPYVKWSISALMSSLQWCDCVILPVDENERNAVKSANRLVEAVRRGRFIIASPIMSYCEFDDWMCVGGIHAGLEWLKGQEPYRIVQRISACQTYIEANFNPTKIGEMWEKALIV